MVQGEKSPEEAAEARASGQTVEPGRVGTAAHAAVADFSAGQRRLRLVRQPPLHPSKLGRIERGHLDHRHTDFAALVKQLRSQRVRESLDRMFRAAVCRLKRNPAVGEGRAATTCQYA